MTSSEPTPLASLVRMNPDYPVIRREFDEAHRAMSLQIYELFDKALKELGTSNQNAEKALYKAHEEHQKFIKKCSEELLKEVKNRKSNAEGNETVALYREMMQTSQDMTIGSTERCIELALKLRENAQAALLAMIDKTLDVKSKFILHEEKRVKIIIERNEALARAELEAKRFMREQFRLDNQQKADILQRQYDAYLDAYKREIQIAQEVLSKSPPGLELDLIPPRIENNTVVQGKVALKKKSEPSPGLSLPNVSLPDLPVSLPTSLPAADLLLPIAGGGCNIV